MLSAISGIEPKTDTAAVVELLKTGYPRPPPFQMEELGGPPDSYYGGDVVDTGAGSTLKRGVLGSGGKRSENSKQVARKQSMHQKLFGNGNDKHKSDGSSNDYSSLPPQQRVRRIQQKLDQLRGEQATTLESHKACIKMQTVYKDNPKMGNPADCEGKLAEFAKKAQELDQQIKRYEALLEDARQALDAPFGAGDHTPPSARSVSVSDHAPQRPPPPSSAQSFHSPSPRTNGNSNHEQEDYASVQLTPALGTCTVLYAYDGSSGEATMRVNEGDEMLLIERDEGDGWTRVRCLNSDQEGFVPTSYLDCKWYPE